MQLKGTKEWLKDKTKHGKFKEGMNRQRKRNCTQRRKKLIVFPKYGIKFIRYGDCIQGRKPKKFNKYPNKKQSIRITLENNV